MESSYQIEKPQAFKSGLEEIEDRLDNKSIVKFRRLHPIMGENLTFTLAFV